MSSRFAKNLKAVLKEAIAHKEGKFDLYSEYIEVPEVSVEQSWEAGKRGPTPSVLRLFIYIIFR
jgi:hypothetical protein